MAIVNGGAGGGGVKVNGEKVTIDAYATVSNGDLGTYKMDFELFKKVSVSLTGVRYNRGMYCIPMSETLIAISYYTYDSYLERYSRNVVAVSLNPDGSVKKAGVPTVISDAGSNPGAGKPIPMTGNSFVLYSDNSFGHYITVSTSLTITSSHIPTHVDWCMQRLDNTHLLQSYTVNVPNTSSQYNRIVSIYDLETRTELTPVVVETIIDSAYWAGYSSQAICPVRDSTTIMASKLDKGLRGIKTHLITLEGTMITVKASRDQTIEYGTNSTNTYLSPVANLACPGQNVAVFRGNDSYRDNDNRYPFLYVPYSGKSMGNMKRKDEFYETYYTGEIADNVVVKIPNSGGEGSLYIVGEGACVYKTDSDSTFQKTSYQGGFIAGKQLPYATWAVSNSDTSITVHLYKIKGKMYRVPNMACVSMQTGQSGIAAIMS